MFVQLLQRHYRTDDFADTGEMLDANRAAGWLYGVAAAGLVAGYGVWVLICGEGWIIRFGEAGGVAPRSPWMLIQGPSAFWYGCTLVGLGLLLHFHSFWGTHPKLSRYHEPAWYATLAGTLFVTGMFAYHAVQRLL